MLPAWRGLASHGSMTLPSGWPVLLTMPDDLGQPLQRAQVSCYGQVHLLQHSSTQGRAGQRQLRSLLLPALHSRSGGKQGSRLHQVPAGSCWHTRGCQAIACEEGPGTLTQKRASLLQ